MKNKITVPVTDEGRKLFQKQFIMGGICDGREFEIGIACGSGRLLVEWGEKTKSVSISEIAKQVIGGSDEN